MSEDSRDNEIRNNARKFAHTFRNYYERLQAENKELLERDLLIFT